VERNLFRRRLRQLARETVPRRGFDAVVSPSVKLAEIRWRNLLEDFDRLVSEAAP
jgi:ribonuclease P protein component